GLNFNFSNGKVEKILQIYVIIYLQNVRNLPYEKGQMI
ncbi:MAG: hypothetical protein H6Q69_4578, partial [Firmicutes bacterium]|nr:hypothetical protein [Bacillota bacterium]